MAPILFHGLSHLGLPVVCVESRQAYQALKSLATHKTDRNDARGLAHLVRTGFFKPVHVKSLQAHALRSLIIAGKKLVGQRVTLENQIRGLAVVFGVRLPRALTVAFIDTPLKQARGSLVSVAMRGLIAARTAVMSAVAAIDADMRRMTRVSAAYRRLMTIPRVGQPTAHAFVAAIDDPSRIRRSRDIRAYLGLGGSTTPAASLSSDRSATPPADLISARLSRAARCHAILLASVGGRKRPDRRFAGRGAVDGGHCPGARSGESHHLQGTAAERSPLGRIFAASRRRSLSIAQAA